MNAEMPLLPWRLALLAVAPGLLAAVGLVRTDFGWQMALGLVILVAYVAVAWSQNRWRLPGWSLMGLGMLASVVLQAATGAMGGLGALVLGQSASLLVLVVLLGALWIVGWRVLAVRGLSALEWTLLAAVVVCQLAVRVKYWTLYGASWAVMAQWVHISLYASVAGLLFPVALGWVLSRRQGKLALLFVIGMIYGQFQILIDVNAKVSGLVGGTVVYSVYVALVPLLFAVCAPLWFLRARSAGRRVGGTLALVSLAVILDLVVVGLSYRGDLPLIIWLSFFPYTVSVLAALALAYKLCGRRRQFQTL